MGLGTQFLEKGCMVEVRQSNGYEAIQRKQESLSDYVKAKPKYSVIKGKFVCQSCQSEVSSSRFYSEDLNMTWMCSTCNNISTVNLYKARGY